MTFQERKVNFIGVAVAVAFKSFKKILQFTA